jgi:hypothetical protein
MLLPECLLPLDIADLALEDGGADAKLKFSPNEGVGG